MDTLIDDLAHEALIGSGEMLHLRDQLGPEPVHPPQFEPRSEMAGARRRLGERHLLDRERLNRRHTRSSSASLIPVPARPAYCSRPHRRSSRIVVVTEQQPSDNDEEHDPRAAARAPQTGGPRA